MATRKRAALVDRLRAVTQDPADLPGLAQAVYAAVGQYVRFDFGCLAATDPASGLITWASKTRSLGIGDEEFAATEYGPPDVNSFAEIARRRPPVGILSIDTGGRPDTCRRHRDFMSPRFGFTDELRAVFLSRATSWGALALYRGPADPPFTTGDADQVAAAGDVIADAIQRSLFHLHPAPRTPEPATTHGPAVLIIDTDDRVTHLSPAARAAIDEFGGLDHGSLPANILAVVVTTRTNGTPTETRTRTTTGRWLSLRAAPLEGPPGRQDVVVTMEPTPRTVLSRLTLAAHGLTAREEDVALLVLQGADTRAIAAALHLSPHTVQDHLKAIFAKLGVSSRRELTAHLVLN